MALWSPPQIQDPITYRYENNGDRVHVFQDGTQILDKSKLEGIEFTAPYNRDVLVELPKDYRLETAGIRMNGGDNVRLIGGALKATTPATAQNTGMLRFGGQSNSCFIEGVDIDCNNQDGVDGIEVGGWGNQLFLPDYYIQNSRIDNVKSLDGNSFHGDCVQHYGSFAHLRIYGLDVSSGTQGFFLAPQHHRISGIDIRKVTLRYTDPTTANGYILYLRDFETGRRPSTYLEDVYVGERDFNPFNDPLEDLWHLYSVFPHSRKSDGNLPHGDPATFCTFPAYPEIIGKVHKLTNQRFAPDSAGAGYVSQGYIGTPPIYINPPY